MYSLGLSHRLSQRQYAISLKPAVPIFPVAELHWHGQCLLPVSQTGQFTADLSELLICAVTAAAAAGSTKINTVNVCNEDMALAQVSVTSWASVLLGLLSTIVSAAGARSPLHQGVHVLLGCSLITIYQ